MIQQILFPEYMNSFKCISSNCDDTCCSEWSVVIDKLTYHKYCSCKDISLKDEIKKNIIINKKSKNIETYAYIKMKQNGICPFLTSDKLCKIQSNLGQDYLSNTCSMYPRKINKVNGIQEVSATLSCPEVTRLAILNKKPMEFIMEQTRDMYHINGRIIDTTKNRLNPMKYFWDLRMFTIQVLQLREYRLWERLAILAMFYKTIQDEIQLRHIDEIPKWIDEYSEAIGKSAFDEALNVNYTNAEIQLDILIEIIKRKWNEGVNSTHYIECYQDFIKGLEVSSKSNMRKIDKYVFNHKKYFLDYISNHEYIFENYLVNYIYSTLFPYTTSGLTFDNFAMIIINYALIKVHVVGMIGMYKQNFSDEQIVKLIQSYSKVISHNNKFINEIYTYFKKNNYINIESLIVLIKD